MVKYGKICLMRRKYDLIFGLGPACSCSETLRHAGLQLLSFPFDWLNPTNYDGDLLRRADFVCNKFNGWIRMEDFECLGEVSNTGMERCRNEALGLNFIHDFPFGKPIGETFDAVASKYQRRIGRLLQLISRSQSVLVVRLDLPHFDHATPLADCRLCREKLMCAFPGTRFDFLLFQPANGIAFADRIVERPDKGLVRIRFDYALPPGPGILPHAVNVRLTGKVARELVSVRDYRTHAERESHAGGCRLLYFRLLRLLHLPAFSV